MIWPFNKPNVALYDGNNCKLVKSFVVGTKRFVKQKHTDCVIVLNDDGTTSYSFMRWEKL